MTQKALSDIEKRIQNAQNGQWFAIIEGRNQTSGSSFIMTGVENIDDIRNPNRGEDIYLTGAADADMDFIAHARQDIPLLLAEIKRLNFLLKIK
jgi:hypothetical protein